jgi:uncharacterized protein (TIGR03084 family)
MSAGADVSQLVDELDAEQRELDSFLSHLDDAQWELPTPAAGWRVRHQVAHLAFFDDVGASCVAGDAEPLLGIRRLAPGRTEDEVSLAVLEPFLHLPPAELLSTWRRARTLLRSAFLDARPDQKVMWAAGPMALPSFVTARLMETWAHGLDCFAAVGVAPVETSRIRHVCRIGYRALPYAFRRAGREMPGSLDDLRLELLGPTGERWTFGPDSAKNVVRGPAGEWARVAVQRLPGEHARGLVPEGDLAVQAIRVARAYA